MADDDIIGLPSGARLRQPAIEGLPPGARVRESTEPESYGEAFQKGGVVGVLERAQAARDAVPSKLPGGLSAIDFALALAKGIRGLSEATPKLYGDEPTLPLPSRGGFPGSAPETDPAAIERMGAIPAAVPLSQSAAAGSGLALRGVSSIARGLLPRGVTPAMVEASRAGVTELPAALVGSSGQQAAARVLSGVPFVGRGIQEAAERGVARIGAHGEQLLAGPTGEAVSVTEGGAALRGGLDEYFRPFGRMVTQAGDEAIRGLQRLNTDERLLHTVTNWAGTSGNA